MSFPWANEYKPSHPFMQWLDEKLPLPRLVYNAVGGGYPVPRNLNYIWNFGVPGRLLCLVIQIVTGIVLAMHYAANAGGLRFGRAHHARRQLGLADALCARQRRLGLLRGGLCPHLPRLLLRSYKAPREMIWLLAW
jgi:ubiquinol-cytochrome c reductase cytochrome b subunit